MRKANEPAQAARLRLSVRSIIDTSSNDTSSRPAVCIEGQKYLVRRQLLQRSCARVLAHVEADDVALLSLATELKCAAGFQIFHLQHPAKENSGSKFAGLKRN